MLPPLNLLAPDTTAFDADVRTWPGTHAADSGFRTTFSGLTQGAAPADQALPELPEDVSGMARLSLAEGEALPHPGKALPLPEADAVWDEIAGLDSIGITLEGPEGLRSSVTEAVVFVPPLGLRNADPAPAATAGLPDSLTAAAFADARSGNPHEAPSSTRQATVLTQFHHVAPDSRARTPAETTYALLQVADPVVEAAPRADLPELPQKNPAAIRDAGLLQQLVQQVADPVQAKAVLHTAADALLPVDTQDARSVLTSATPPPFATRAASASSPQWVASQIHASPGNPGWNEALGERVSWMAGNKVQNAELRLNPAELGPVRVQISIDDGNATVNFTAQHPLTRDAIEQALPRLREMLADQGLLLQNANVSEQGKGEEHSGPRHQDGAPAFAPDRNGRAGNADDHVLPATRHAAGLVDLFA
jgi:flagellar hook-length control protein FliK